MSDFIFLKCASDISGRTFLERPPRRAFDSCNCWNLDWMISVAFDAPNVYAVSTSPAPVMPPTNSARTYSSAAKIIQNRISATRTRMLAIVERSEPLDLLRYMSYALTFSAPASTLVPRRKCPSRPSQRKRERQGQVANDNSERKPTRGM
jgi:hypothetical protein